MCSLEGLTGQSTDYWPIPNTNYEISMSVYLKWSHYIALITKFHRALFVKSPTIIQHVFLLIKVSGNM